KASAKDIEEFGEHRSRIERSELARQLDELGYRAVSTVTSVGEYALRGGLVDIYPVGEELPCRVDLFGDEIDQISVFVPETQRSEKQIERVRILPLAPHLAHLQRSDVLKGIRRRWEDYKQQN